MNTKQDKTTENKAKTQAKSEERDPSLLFDTLPLPDPRFQGRIGGTYADSEADLISLPTPPVGAPNVLLVLLDDVSADPIASPSRSYTRILPGDPRWRRRRGVGCETVLHSAPPRLSCLYGLPH